MKTHCVNYGYFGMYKQTKKWAVKYFKDVFDDCYNVKENPSATLVERKYIEYCAEHHINARPIRYTQQSFEIQNAYEFVKQALEDTEEYELKNAYTKELLSIYTKLVRSIGNHTFNSRFDSSYGDRQNKTTQNILLDLSLMYPAVLGTLHNVDCLLEKEITNCGTIENLQSIGLGATLHNLVQNLHLSCEDLENAQKNYHTAWDTNNNREWTLGRNRVTMHELGEQKKEWRLSRNRACNTLLNTLDELRKINNGYYFIDVSTPTSHAERLQDQLLYAKIFQEGIDNIKTGKFSFCYLDKEEKNKLAAQKVLRKQRSSKPATQE